MGWGERGGGDRARWMLLRIEEADKKTGREEEEIET